MRHMAMRTRQELQDRYDLTGRVAIVTGGSRGIGRAIAETYAAAGAAVVIASRKADACDAGGRRDRGARGRAIAVPTHAGHLDELEALVGATVDQLGGVDIVVNNAANALGLPIGSITPEAWEKSHAVNLRGPLFLFQYALPHLLKSEHAAVVNVISAGAFTHGTYVSMYCSAKAAMVTMTRAMAAEFAGRGHPRQRARARHHRHRHGAQQRRGLPAGHGRRGADQAHGHARGARGRPRSTSRATPRAS